MCSALGCGTDNARRVSIRGWKTHVVDFRVAASYLLLVLDTSGGRRDHGPVANVPRLVDKHSGEETTPTVPDALILAERMALVLS